MLATTLVAQTVSAKHFRTECRSLSSARQLDAKSLEVFKVLGGAERQMMMHSYLFDVLKAIHKKDVPGLNNLCRIMAGVARTKSLNIGLRHRSVKPSSAKACPPVAHHFTQMSSRQVACISRLLSQQVCRLLHRLRFSPHCRTLLLFFLVPKESFAQILALPIKKPQ